MDDGKLLQIYDDAGDDAVDAGDSGPHLFALRAVYDAAVLAERERSRAAHDALLAAAKRLEVAPHGIDGIAARDETIRMLEAERDALRALLREARGVIDEIEVRSPEPSPSDHGDMWDFYSRTGPDAMDALVARIDAALRGEEV